MKLMGNVKINGNVIFGDKVKIFGKLKINGSLEVNGDLEVWGVLMVNGYLKCRNLMVYVFFIMVDSLWYEVESEMVYGVKLVYRSGYVG